MIHTAIINELKRIDDIETEIIQNNPWPITYDDDDDDEIYIELRRITEHKLLLIKQFAASLGLKCEESKFPFDI